MRWEGQSEIEKQTPHVAESLEPDMGFDLGAPGSQLEPQADA